MKKDVKILFFLVERKHKCNECGKCFISERHFRVHFRVHTRQKPYRCEFCPKVFTLLKMFNNHLKTHNKHRCKVCDERFPCLEEYKVHKCFSKKEPKDDTANTEIEKEFVNFELNR